MTTDRNFPIGEPVLEVKNISLSFGGVKAITDSSFSVLEHEIKAIIGPNGAGKSSLLNCINGIYQPQEGSIAFKGEVLEKNYSQPNCKKRYLAHISKFGFI